MEGFLHPDHVTLSKLQYDPPPPSPPPGADLGDYWGIPGEDWERREKRDVGGGTWKNISYIN